MSDPDQPDRYRSRRKKPRTFGLRFITIIFALIALLMVVVFALGMACGARWATTAMAPSTTEAVPSEGFPLKQGPWGEVYYFPVTIAAPYKTLPVGALEATGTHWFFKNFSRDDLAAFLQSAKVPAPLRDALLNPAVLHILPGGIDVTPAFDSLLTLPPDSRKEIYQCLARFPENNTQLFYFQTATLEQRFEGSGVSRETIGLFTKLSCQYGSNVVFTGMSSLLAHLQNDNEKMRFLKALASQQTMLLRLRVRSGSDIDALSIYWGKGRYATDVRTMLKSIAQETDWTWFDIPEVFPPLPSSQLYSYPIVPDNPPTDAPVKHDVNWTSFNFFNEVPDNSFANPDYVAQRLKAEYEPVSGNPLYGDLVLSAVYMADDIVFNKNGDSLMDPWILSTIEDLTAQYSFQLPEDQKLTVTYFRSNSF